MANTVDGTKPEGCIQPFGLFVFDSASQPTRPILNMKTTLATLVDEGALTAEDIMALATPDGIPVARAVSKYIAAVLVKLRRQNEDHLTLGDTVELDCRTINGQIRQARYISEVFEEAKEYLKEKET